MIHFDFTLDDEDAELLFECVNYTIRQATKEKLFGKNTKAESDWLTKHVIHLELLKTRIQNKLV
jgi:hypothetical protein